MWYDSDFSLSEDVQNVCKSCFVKLCVFRQVRWFLMFLCLWLMLLLVVGWITATHCSGASPSSIYANYSASKTVQPELYQTGILLHIFLPTAVLILPGAVKVVAISLSFYTSVHKSVKQFGNSFAFDAPTVWNALPDKSRASPSLASLRK